MEYKGTLELDLAIDTADLQKAFDTMQEIIANGNIFKPLLAALDSLSLKFDEIEKSSDSFDGVINGMDSTLSLLINLATVINATTAAFAVNTTTMKLNTAATSGGIITTIAAAAAAKVAAAAQWVWNAAMSANPIMLVIAGVAALGGAIAGLIAALSGSSEAYQQQKADVEAITKAQEELNAVTEESAAAYRNAEANINATATVASDYLKELDKVANSTADAGEKNRQMADTVAKLNTAVDGLNIAYDEETGAITDINSGQEISLAQLNSLVEAKSELARANAWQERANELIAEEVQIQEELAIIAAERADIEADEGLRDGERRRLLRDLEEAENEHLETQEDIAERLVVVNDQIRTSETETSEAVISEHERRQDAITRDGESLEEVADKWNVSGEQILAEMAEMGADTTLDDWLGRQTQAFEAWQAAATEGMDTVVNGFKELPESAEITLEELNDTLATNNERYAAWKQNLVQASAELAPEMMSVIESWGPGYNSLLEEYLGDPTGEKGQAFYDQLLQAMQTGAMGLEDGAPTPEQMLPSTEEFAAAGAAARDAFTSSFAGESSTAGGSETESSTGSAMAAAAEFANNFAEGIETSLAEADLSGIPEALLTGIENNAEAFTEVGKLAGTYVLDGFNESISEGAQQGAPQGEGGGAQGPSGIVDTMLDDMLAAMQNDEKIELLETGAKGIADAIIEKLQAMIDGGQEETAGRTGELGGGIGAVNDMIDNMLIAMQDEEKNMLLTDEAKDIADGIVDKLGIMVDGKEGDSKDKNSELGAIGAANYMMDGMLTAMQDKAELLYTKAKTIADTISAKLKIAWDEHSPSKVSYKIMDNYMQGMYNAMREKSGQLYYTIDDIAEGMSDRARLMMQLTPEILEPFVARMDALIFSNPFPEVGLVPPIPPMPGVGFGYGANGVQYTTNLTQNITSPKPLSPSEMTRQAQDLLRRSKWQLP